MSSESPENLLKINVSQPHLSKFPSINLLWSPDLCLYLKREKKNFGNCDALSEVWTADTPTFSQMRNCFNCLLLRSSLPKEHSINLWLPTPEDRSCHVKVPSGTVQSEFEMWGANLKSLELLSYYIQGWLSHDRRSCLLESAWVLIKGQPLLQGQLQQNTVIVELRRG